MKHGHVDIGIRAAGWKERQLLDEIRRRPGYFLQRVHGNGTTLRLIGPGVHVTVAALSSLTLADLDPLAPVHHGIR